MDDKECSKCHRLLPHDRFYTSSWDGGPTARCKECAAKDTKDRVQRLKDAGLCIACGRRPARENRQTCATHSNPNPEASNRNGRAMRERRKIAGLCLGCGRLPPMAGRRKCEECAIKARPTAERSAETHRRKSERRKAGGLCVKCREPAIQNRTLCATHAAEYKKYAENNKDQIRAYKRSIREHAAAQRRTPAYREVKNANRRRRFLADPQYDIVERLRKRIGRAIRDHGAGRKNLTTGTLIGCSVAELIAHLESRFLIGMSWENRRDWHIDHIRPCASFDLTKPEQQKACFHFTNLQPLWAADNISKHAKVLDVAA